jgi:hypothetical protein
MVIQAGLIHASCCCPSFIIVIAGPTIRVLGAVFTDVAWADPLTETISLGPDKIDIGEKMDTVARLFVALRDGLRSLHTFYHELEIESPDEPTYSGACFFPHVRSYPGGEQAHPIQYIAQLGPEDKSKAVFKAETSDGQMIVVKFSDRYHVMAHRLLVKHGFAPQLLYHSSENTNRGDFGYQVMVVMEFVEGRTAEEMGLATSKYK